MVDSGIALMDASGGGHFTLPDDGGKRQSRES
jgi:hypothetical protein